MSAPLAAPRRPATAARSRLSPALAASLAAHFLLFAVLFAGAWLLPAAPLPAPGKLATVEVVMGGGAERTGTPPDKQKIAPPAPKPPPPAVKPEPPKPAPPPPKPAPEPPKPLPAPPEPPPMPPKPASEAAASAPVPASTPVPEPPKPVWQAGPLLGDGTVGAAKLLGSQLRPAKSDNGNIPPAYPLLSAELGEQGIVVVELFIAPDGRVANAVVQRTSGYPRLDQAAQTALSRWHFAPAVQDGQPVPSRLLLPVRFRLH